MAQRRMFSKTVTQSARFLRLSATARLLYYDLGMSADDDGIVEAFPVLRMTAASADDLQELEKSGHIAMLNDDLVCYITDWQKNNQIKNDRYHRSDYYPLLLKYVEYDLETRRKQNGTILEPQNSKG